MHASKKLRRFILGGGVVSILLLVLLIGFETVLLGSEGDAQYTSQAALQIGYALSTLVATYQLEYRSATKGAQAMSDVEILMPLFAQLEDLLATDHTTQVQDFLQQTRLDYLSIERDGKTIIAHKRTDPIVVNSIELHARSYTLKLYALLGILQQREQSRNVQLFFIIEVTIEAMLIIFIAITIFIIVRKNRTSG